MVLLFVIRLITKTPLRKIFCVMVVSLLLLVTACMVSKMDIVCIIMNDAYLTGWLLGSYCEMILVSQGGYVFIASIRFTWRLIM